MTRSSLLNNTQDNQGDHCIFAFNTAPGRPPQQSGNQVIDASRCPRLGPSVVVPAAGFPVEPVFSRD